MSDHLVTVHKVMSPSVEIGTPDFIVREDDISGDGVRPPSPLPSTSPSALDDIDGEPAFTCFLVTHGHVVSGLAHGFDDGIEAHHMRPVTQVCELSCGDCSRGGYGISFDAWDLDQATNRIA